MLNFLTSILILYVSCSNYISHGIVNVIFPTTVFKLQLHYLFYIDFKIFIFQKMEDEMSKLELHEADVIKTSLRFTCDSRFCESIIATNSMQLRSRRHNYDDVQRKTVNKVIPNKYNTNVESQIKKLYLNKGIKKFKPTLLETVFEESEIINNESDKKFIIGKFKRKRSLTFSDGANIPKNLQTKRKKRVKSTFGKKHKFKKINNLDFQIKLKTMHYSDLQDESIRNEKELEILRRRVSELTS